MAWLCLWHGEDVLKDKLYPQCFLDMTDETALTQAQHQDDKNLGNEAQEYHDKLEAVHEERNRSGPDKDEEHEDAGQDSEDELDRIIELCEVKIEKLELGRSEKATVHDYGWVTFSGVSSNLNLSLKGTSSFLQPPCIVQQTNLIAQHVVIFICILLSLK